MKITKGVINRLQQVNQEAGLSNRKFSMSLGQSASTIQEIYSGRVKTLSGSIMLLLEMKYGVNIEWLKTGKGPKKTEYITTVDIEETNLLKDFRLFAAYEKEIILSILKVLLQKQQQKG